MLTDAKRMLQILNEREIKIDKARINMSVRPTSSLDPFPPKLQMQ